VGLVQEVLGDLVEVEAGLALDPEISAVYLQSIPEI
jgi:hypothetical protein